MTSSESIYTKCININADELEVQFLNPELRLFDELSVSDSNISVLSDPFSDKECMESKPPPPKIDGKDVFTVFGFSPTLKSIMEEAGLKSMGVKTMMAETPDQIRARAVFTQVKKKVPLMAQVKIANLLNSRDIAFGEENALEPEFIPDEKRTWEDLKDEVFQSRSILKNIRKMTEKEKNKKAQKAKADLEAYETMSGYWRLLSNYETFKISHQGFNAYAGPKPHWLETEQIPSEVLEESRRKVIGWLEKHFRSY